MARDGTITSCLRSWIESLQHQRAGPPHNAPRAAAERSWPITLMEQRAMFIEDQSRCLAPIAAQVRHAGYVARYRGDRDTTPLSGWWISREDTQPFRQDEVRWLLATFRMRKFA